jgi:DNA mismatch repair ATPase MutS
VRIFEKNDFYYLFEKDAEFAAQLTYGSSTVTKTMGRSSPLTYCSMNHANFDSLLRQVLLVKNYRVEVYKFVAPRAGQPAKYDLEVGAVSSHFHSSSISRCVLRPETSPAWSTCCTARARNARRPTTL